MRIEVKQIDIDLGEQGNACNCPIARAIKRTLGWRSVYVRREGVYRRDPSTELPVRLPPAAIRFMTRFDAIGDEVSPIAFDLPIDELGGGA